MTASTLFQFLRQKNRLNGLMAASFTLLIVLSLSHHDVRHVAAARLPSFARSTLSPAEPVVARAVNAHFELERQSRRYSPRETLAVALRVASADQPRCAAVEQLLSAFRGGDDRWLSFEQDEQTARRCGGASHAVTDTSRHEVVFVRVEDAVMDSHDGPNCRDCASKLVVVHSPDPRRLEDKKAEMLDTGLAWMVVSDVQSTPTGHFFALRALPLAAREERHLRRFRDLQTRDLPCSEQKFILAEYQRFGFGSSIAMLAGASYYAAMHNRTIIYRPGREFAYLPPNFCESDNLNCYFHGFFHRQHRCLDYVDAEIKSRPVLDPPKAKQGPRQLDPASRDASDPVWLLEWPNPAGFDGTYYDFLRKNGYDVRASLTGLLLLNPTRRVREGVEEHSNGGSKLARYIGAHVRHGDKKLEATLVNFTSYMDEVERRGRASGIRDVFLATDDAEVVERETSEYPLLRFSLQDTLRPKSGFWYDGFRGKQFDLFLSVYTDVAMLSQADIFVGTGSSSMSTLVQALRGVLHKHETYMLDEKGVAREAAMSEAFFD
ncbi:RHTO0S12e01618g1_1 [Rhodotorula toruloides]|uniref:RHTO0S12e01618g1_1 n=2 Tax=Rhodotorula toruloides TaxID=5286 RepID=A0A061B8G2_RHOTO|nr:RHTO0S12e01618g1_1 [Rhodotorula toruloides]